MKIKLVLMRMLLRVETAYDDSLHPNSPKDLSDSIPSLIDDSHGHDSPIGDHVFDFPIGDHVSNSFSSNQQAGKDSSSDFNSATQKSDQGAQVSDSLKKQLPSVVDHIFSQRVYDDLQIVLKFLEGSTAAYDLNEKDLVYVPVMASDQDFTVVMSKSQKENAEKE